MTTTLTRTELSLLNEILNATTSGNVRGLATKLAATVDALEAAERGCASLRLELEAARADVERLTKERDALSARVDLVERRAIEDGKAWKHDAERAENAEAALTVARQLGMSIEPRPEPMVWALKNERAQVAEAERDALHTALAGLVDWNRHRYPPQMDGAEFPPSLRSLMLAAGRALGDIKETP